MLRQACPPPKRRGHAKAALDKTISPMTRGLIAVGLFLLVKASFAQVEKKQRPNQNPKTMETMIKVAVWDTYVKREDGRLMHFDIVVPENTEKEKVFSYGTEYLRAKGIKGVQVTNRESRYCHSEMAKPEVQKAILEKGYYIFEMENCD